MEWKQKLRKSGPPAIQIKWRVQEARRVSENLEASPLDFRIPDPLLRYILRPNIGGFAQGTCTAYCPLKLLLNFSEISLDASVLYSFGFAVAFLLGSDSVIIIAPFPYCARAIYLAVDVEKRETRSSFRLSRQRFRGIG